MPELRWDPLQERWTLIAPERRARPRRLAHPPATPVAPDPDCPFCPGREDQTPPETAALRGEGAAVGWRIRAFPNKFAALGPGATPALPPEGVLQRMDGIGRHEVVIDSPDHCRGLADLPDAHTAEFLGFLQDRARDFYRDPRIRAIVVFKNHGLAAGASMEHPHLQMAGLPVLPDALARERRAARRHFERTGRPLLERLLAAERERTAGIIEGGEKEGCVAWCPYASRIAYQAAVAPWPLRGAFLEATPETLAAAGGALARTLRRMKRALGDPPFNALLQFGRREDGSDAGTGWRIDIYPRLIPLAGLEVGAGLHINEVPPEEAASALRSAEAD